MTTTTNFLEIFEYQMHSSYIDKLFWIAGQSESSELKDFIGDLNKDDWEQLIPDLYNSEYFDEYFNDGEMLDMMLENGKFGFFAEVDHPNHTGFTFDKNGDFQSCCINGSHCDVSYVYAETIEELTEKIKEVSEKVFQEMILRDKKKK